MVNKKIIIPIIAIAILTAGVGAYFVFQKVEFTKLPIAGECKNGNCDALPASKQKPTPSSPVTVATGSKFTDFVMGIKLDNFKEVREVSKMHFDLARELKLDYVLVPVTFPRGSSANNPDWSKGLDYYYITELSKQYGVKILPAFYKLGNKDDKNYEKYADFVLDFLNEFYADGNIKYIEFQNEPTKEYDGTVSPRFGGTAADLAKSHLEAYQKVKEKYPLIKVGTAGFMAAAVAADENKMMNDYYAEYFSAKPKFDMFSLHHYPKNSSYLQTKGDSYSKYNFMSEYEIFDAYRQLLDDFGYGEKPIFVSEGAVGMPFKNSDGSMVRGQWLSDENAQILLAERTILFLENGKKNNIIAAMTSNSEAAVTGLFSADKKSGALKKTELFDFYKTLLNFLEKYPIYSERVSGAVDAEQYWISEFKNTSGKKMWIGFCPFLFWAEAENSDRLAAVAVKKAITCPQAVSLDVDGVKTVKISTVSENYTVEVVGGKVNFELGESPVFVEEK